MIIHGAGAMQKAGIEMLGYPGTWATHNSEIRKIKEKLCQQNQL